MNENNERDELFHNRLKIALHQVNGQSNGFDSSASIEAELATVHAAPMDDAEVDRIMNQVHRSILEAAKSREGMDVMQNRTLSQIASSTDQLGRQRILRKRSQSGTAALLALVATSLCLLTAFGLVQVTKESKDDNKRQTPGTQLTYMRDPLKRSSHHFRYAAQPRSQVSPPERLFVGQTIHTADRERRRAMLPDGSILYLNERSTVALTANRTVELHRGQLFVEVTPADISKQGPFVVKTPDRSVTALGTRFAVSTDAAETEVLVTQGKVRVSGASSVVTGGQVAASKGKDSEVTIDAAPRASQALSWTRELIAAAESPLVPRSDHDGGSLVVVDTSGQEMKLSLRKFHVDAHIQDGFARTTIDQTYFNHTHSRQEGTFKFPLPPDASLSRLAMYVNGKLMEGGMVERDHGRNVFEQIMHTKRDPALLEWVDGSTFKMRVFPLEPRQEKRIVLSYTQRLPNDYDRTVYRFPAGHSLDQVRDWSTRLIVAGGARETRWFSPTHLLKATEEETDLVLEGDLQNAVLDEDLVVELTTAEPEDLGLLRKVKESIAFSEAEHEGYRYQMVRFSPDLNGNMRRPNRNWIFLYESSGDRNPLLARVQLDVISTMLKHAEHDDTFSVISAATNIKSFRARPVRCSKKNIEKAIDWLEDAHLVGALDLQKAFNKAEPFCRSDGDTILVHVGSANPVLGERDEKKLLKSLPSDAQYVGVGVGKRWLQTLMKSAAGQTGGHFTQINPDEKVSWRAFELLSALNAPRLVDLKVDCGRKNIRFLTFADTIVHGQEFAAIARVPMKSKPLEAITVTGTLNGQAYSRKLPIGNVAQQANYLPRTWARLEIDRLVANGSASNKDAIIKLSKAMYVMSPFTSLLVLENEAMYEQFNVDRGRKDHWALYPAPKTIQVVHEPGPTLPTNEQPAGVLKKNLKAQLARLDVAKANYDLGVRDRRNADELEKLKSLLTREEQNTETLRNRLKLVEQIEGQKSADIAKTVLYRCPPPIAVSLADVNGISRRQRLSRSSWNREQFKFMQPTGTSPLIDTDFLNYWGRQPWATHKVWSEDITRNGILDRPILPGRNNLYFNGPTDSRHFTTFNGQDFGDGAQWEFTPEFDFSFGEQALRQEFESRMLGDIQLRPGSNVAHDRLVNGITEEFILGLDFSGNTYVDESLRSIRPRLMMQQQEMEKLLKGLPAIQGIDPSPSRFNHLIKGLSRRDNSLLIDLAIQPPGDTNRNAPLYTVTVADMNAIPAGLPFTASSNPVAAGAIPVTPYYGQPIEGWHSEGERFGQVPILDGFSISMNSTDALLDEIEDLKSVMSMGYPGQPIDSSESSSARPFGFIQKRGFRASSDVTISQQLSGIALPNYQHIEIPANRSVVLKNILSYAPGMQTSTADILAVVDAESKASQAQARGKIDAAALRLIEKSRSLGWEEITFIGKNKDGNNKLTCNGAGALRLERRTADGLFEQIISDGVIVQHLYPELSIGAKRTISRFHRRALLTMTPWLLPPAEDLAIGCNIRRIDGNTIRITRVENPNSKETAENNELLHEDSELAIELVFGDDGRVTERRLVKLSAKPKPTRQLLLHHIYTTSGNIQIFDKNGKLLKEIEIQRKPITAPSEVQANAGLVVLPLPYRSADSYSLTLPAQPASNGNVDYSQLSEADALKLVATHVANSDFDALWNVINQRFVAKEDARMGFAVLLSGSATSNSQPIHEVASHNQGSSALGSFLVQHFDWVNSQDRSKEFVLSNSASPFLQHQADLHNLYALWSSGRATQDRTEAQVNNELNRALNLIRDCNSKRIAWLLLNVVHKSIDETFPKKKLYQRLAKEATSFEDEPGLFGAARHARVLWLISADATDEARKLYESFRREAITTGLTPSVSDEIRSAFLTKTGSSDEWSRLILRSAELLAKQHRSLELLQLALECAVIAEHETARQLLDIGIRDVNLNTRPDLLITGLRCLITTDDWERAEEFARLLLSYKNVHQNASLWRTASQIATALGDDDESLRRLEQAMRLEFSSLPDMVDVESLRADYNKLFDSFTSYSEKMLERGESPPDDFAERIMQAADAWRSIDPDPTFACQRAARLLQTLGLYDIAWEYWTTPLINTASSSSAWSSLAFALAETKQIHRASEAWGEAFAAEPTNPELLWNHANLLRNHNQSARARKLLSQIIKGKWQPRFANFKSKAKSLLQRL